jgi:hypothetical protein
MRQLMSCFKTSSSQIGSASMYAVLRSACMF